MAATAAQMQSFSFSPSSTGIRSSKVSVEDCRGEFWGTNSRAKFSQIAGHGGEQTKNGRQIATIKAEGLNFWELLGGRGLVGGEISINTDKGFEKLLSEPVESLRKKAATSSVERAEFVIDGDFSIDKELSGLVGGFPGGEKGVFKFLQDNPPKDESKKAKELETLRESIGGAATKPSTVAPPLLMPGMIVIVKNAKNPYFNFTGIVQRVTDGRAGVLFEGGNWDRLVGFKLTELERSANGPPMSNPKSAILLQRPESVSSNS